MDQAGSSSDKIGRFVYSLIVKRRFSPQPFYFTYFPDMSGIEGLKELAASRDPDHTLLLTADSFLTVPLRHRHLKLDVLKFAPLAQLGEEPIMFSVGSKGKAFSGADEFSAFARAKDNWVTAGATEDSQQDLLNDYINAALHMKSNFAAVGGGEESAGMVESGVADSVLALVSEQRELIGLGKMKPVFVFGDKRLAAYPNVPATKEWGWEVSNVVTRSIAGSSQMSEAARNYYTGLFGRVFRLRPWSEYRAVNSIEGPFASGPELREVWKKRLRANYFMVALTMTLRQ